MIGPEEKKQIDALHLKCPLCSANWCDIQATPVDDDMDYERFPTIHFSCGIAISWLNEHWEIRVPKEGTAKCLHRQVQQLTKATE